MLLANTRASNSAFLEYERVETNVSAIKVPNDKALMAMASATPGLLIPQFMSTSSRVNCTELPKDGTTAKGARPAQPIVAPSHTQALVLSGFFREGTDGAARAALISARKR